MAESLRQRRAPTAPFRKFWAPEPPYAHFLRETQLTLSCSAFGERLRRTVSVVVAFGERLQRTSRMATPSAIGYACNLSHPTIATRPEASCRPTYLLCPPNG